jgi:hypothetical protein
VKAQNATHGKVYANIPLVLRQQIGYLIGLITERGHQQVTLWTSVTQLSLLVHILSGLFHVLPEI